VRIGWLPLTTGRRSAYSGLGVELVGRMLFAASDSPLFSTLVAGSAEAEIKGTALTIVNCIGYALTIVSLQLLGWLGGWLGLVWCYPLLALGPILGLWGLFSGAAAGTKGRIEEQA